MDYVLGTVSNEGAHGTHNIPGPHGTAHAVTHRSVDETTAEALCGETVHVWSGRHFPTDADNCQACMSLYAPPVPPL
jgi:hypothetical protein